MLVRIESIMRVTEPGSLHVAPREKKFNSNSKLHLDFREVKG